MAVRPGDRARAEDGLFLAKLDRILDEDQIATDGLKRAMHPDLEPDDQL